MLRALALVVVLGATAALTTPVDAAPHRSEPPAGPVVYVHPVDAEVVDPFRPPATRFGAGNRGLTYATEPGTEVRAAAEGEVVFAGQVGGALHVTLAHPDGRLTSYSGVAAIGVRLHQRVARGEAIARTRDVLHVGVREGGEYVDPAALFGQAALGARLVPEVDLDPGLRAADWLELGRVARRLGGGPGVFERVGGVVGRLGGAAGALVERGFVLVSVARDLFGAGWVVLDTYGPALLDVVWHVAPFLLARAHPLASGVFFLIVVPLVQGDVPPILLFAGDLLMTVPRIAQRTLEWWRLRQHCTPGGVEPPRPDGQRVAVLVGGLDSRSDAAAIGDLDTDALGYPPDHVIGFSYAGGRTPGLFDDEPDPVIPELADLPVQPYDRDDSSTDLEARGEALADLLTEIAHRTPDARIDLFGHSQGGVVARHALVVLARRPEGLEVIEQLGLVATIAAPHTGADLATMATSYAGPLAQSARLRTAGRVLGVTTHPRGTTVGDLARGSDFLEGLHAVPLPDGPTYLSLAARGDWIVTDARSRLPGTHVTLPGIGLDVHSDVVDEPATTRELALGLAGLPPTCESLWDFLGDVVVAEAVQVVSSGVGFAIARATLPISPVDVLEPLVRW